MNNISTRVFGHGSVACDRFPPLQLNVSPRASSLLNHVAAHRSPGCFVGIRSIHFRGSIVIWSASLPRSRQCDTSLPVPTETKSHISLDRHRKIRVSLPRCLFVGGCHFSVNVDFRWRGRIRAASYTIPHHGALARALGPSDIVAEYGMYVSPWKRIGIPPFLGGGWAHLFFFGRPSWLLPCIDRGA